MCATCVVKIMGAVFKIPLTNILGMEGMAYFGAAYHVFGFAFGVLMSGLPTAMAAMIASYNTLGQHDKAQMLFTSTRVLFPCMGAVYMIAMASFASPLAEIMGEKNSIPAIIAISPTIVFSCIMAVYKGYDQGTNRMGPVALSQVTEGIFRPIFGLLGAYIPVYIGKKMFLSTGMAFGVPVMSIAGAVTASLPYAAAGAVLGVALSEGCGAAAIRLCHKNMGMSPRCIRKERLDQLGKLFRMSLPLTLTGAIVNLAGIIDLGTIFGALASEKEALVGIYGQSMSITAEKAPAIFYGAYQTAMNIYWLVPGIVSAIGMVSLPLVSAAYACGDRKLLKNRIERGLSAANVLCMPAGMGIFALAEPILKLLYSSRGSEIIPAIMPLRILGLALCFTGITGPATAMLQGMGKGKILLVFMSLTAGVKLFVNWILVYIPALNVSGAAIGSLISFLVLTGCLLWYLIKHVGKLNFTKIFFCPLVGGIMCGAAAFAVHGVLKDGYGVVVAVLAGGVVWFVSMCLMGENPVNFLRKK